MLDQKMHNDKEYCDLIHCCREFIFHTSHQL